MCRITKPIGRIRYHRRNWDIIKESKGRILIHWEAKRPQDQTKSGSNFAYKWIEKPT